MRVRRLGCLIAVCVAAVAAVPSGALAAGSAHRAVRLSNERTFTRWAHITQVGPIRVRPSAHARAIARLHRYTEDGFAEVYLLLESRTAGSDQGWVKLRIPGRPNGRVGWVRRADLGLYHLTDRLLIVNRERERITLEVKGRKVWSAPVGVGGPATPTPAGHFWIRERFVIHDRSSGYWPYAFGTADYSRLTDWPGGGVVGIHGPYYDAAGIPGRISHGCIRLRTAADAWLGHHITIGDPLLVR